MCRSAASTGAFDSYFSFIHQPMSQDVTENTPPPLPDHLSVDPRSPHYDATILERDIGVRFNDHERHDVEEYCLSEGWIKVPAGKTLDRHGRPLLIKLKGKVEVYYRQTPPAAQS